MVRRRSKANQWRAFMNGAFLLLSYLHGACSLVITTYQRDLGKEPVLLHVCDVDVVLRFIKVICIYERCQYASAGRPVAVASQFFIVSSTCNVFIVAIFGLLPLLKDRFIVLTLRYRVYLLVIHFYWRFILRKL